MSRGFVAFLIVSLVFTLIITGASVLSARNMGGMGNRDIIDNPASSQRNVLQPAPPSEQDSMSTWRSRANEEVGQNH